MLRAMEKNFNKMKRLLKCIQLYLLRNYTDVYNQPLFRTVIYTAPGQQFIKKKKKQFIRFSSVSCFLCIWCDVESIYGLV